LNILGLIPARSGSKGVPGKNIKLLGGKPLITYTIESAKATRLISVTAVSSDSQHILDIAIKAEVMHPILRPAEIATDNTPTLPVILHALETMKEAGHQFDAVCLLQPTSPFRSAEFIDEAIQKFIQSKADSLISVLPVPHEFNPHWTFEANEDGLLKIATGEDQIIPRRQELPPAYFRDGSIYLTKVSVLQEQKSLYGKTITYIQSDQKRYINIDTMDDWKIAENMICAV
jgi:CMP-N,N'-diacetyllegionaminic acid synthase